MPVADPGRMLVAGLLFCFACAGEETEDPLNAMASDGEEQSDQGESGFVPPSFGQWERYEPPGAVCADGSQYKYFVNFSDTSQNLVVFFQGGGACWDYKGCTGDGIRAPVNLNGIPDDYAVRHAAFDGLQFGVDLVYPLLSNRADVNPMADWNKVFVPYCTGDVYSGDATVVYEDPEGQAPSVTFNHSGHQNVVAMIDELGTMFEDVQQMMVGGCSAGGAGALNNYYFFREALSPSTSYLLNDSAPLFPDQASTSRSLLLHNRVREAWNGSALLDKLPQAASIQTDFGNLSSVLAAEFPDDRLATVFFRLDYNYSLYSYERFYEVEEGMISVFGDGEGLGGLGLDETIAEDRAAVYQLFAEDTALLRNQFDGIPNLGYFIPYYRRTNSSHCLTIPGVEEFSEDEVAALLFSDLPRLVWAGTELDTETGETVNLLGYLEHLLDDEAPLMSYFETMPEGPFVACTPEAYDQTACQQAVVGDRR